MNRRTAGLILYQTQIRDGNEGRYFLLCQVFASGGARFSGLHIVPGVN